MSTAGVCGSILGLMAWKSEVQDEIVRSQKDLRALTNENSYWTKAQCNFEQGSNAAPTISAFYESVHEGWIQVNAGGGDQGTTWTWIQDRIDDLENRSQVIEAEVAQEQSDLATIEAEIQAEQGENKENNKNYYGNPFAG